MFLSLPYFKPRFLGFGACRLVFILSTKGCRRISTRLFRMLNFVNFLLFTEVAPLNFTLNLMYVLTDLQGTHMHIRLYLTDVSNQLHIVSIFAFTAGISSLGRQQIHSGPHN